jgi:membrane protein DedA with SNARE-associated domain
MLLGLLQGLIDMLTGSLWSYPLHFGICAGDALIPAFPSETAVIVCGIQAARGQLSLEWVIVVAAAGAFAGDNASYAVGHWFGTPAVKRFFSGEVAQGRVDWARNFLEERGSYVLIVARFIPGGRTAATLTAGLVHLRWLTQFAPYVFIAAIRGRSTGRFSAISAGASSKITDGPAACLRDCSAGDSERRGWRRF